jgi:hypothetical protein
VHYREKCNPCIKSLKNHLDTVHIIGTVLLVPYLYFAPHLLKTLILYNQVYLAGLCKELCSCGSRRVQELYFDGNVICIPDDSLPYKTPGFPNYRELGASRNQQLDKQVTDFEAAYAESYLHGQLRCALLKRREVRYFKK